MRAAVVLGLGFVAGCFETRGEPDALAIQEACYELEPGGSVTIHAQARDSAALPVDGVEIEWSVAPDELFTLEAEKSTTGSADLGAVKVKGVASVVIKAMAEVGEADEATLTAATVVNNSVGTDTAQLRLMVEDSEGCPALVDAGVDAAPPDAGPPDAAR